MIMMLPMVALARSSFEKKQASRRYYYGTPLPVPVVVVIDSYLKHKPCTTVQ